jgi:hypothetical protein
MDDNQQKDFRFRFQPLAHTSDYLVLSFLKSFKPVVDGNELALMAFRLCWLPYAYRHFDLKKGQALKKTAQQVVLLLSAHIERIRVEFGLEPNLTQCYPQQDAPPASPVRETQSSDGFEDAADLEFETSGL